MVQRSPFCRRHQRKPTEDILSSANGQRLRTLGRRMVSFRLFDRKCSYDIIVTDVVHPIFGMDFFQDGWPEAFLMTMRGETAKANACTNVLVCQLIARWSIPDIIASDRGSQFVSDLWLEICRWMGIARDPTTTCHPQLNGNVERMHRCLKNSLRARLLGRYIG